jgi:hypothetical protein
MDYQQLLQLIKNNKYQKGAQNGRRQKQKANQSRKRSRRLDDQKMASHDGHNVHERVCV